MIKLLNFKILTLLNERKAIVVLAILFIFLNIGLNTNLSIRNYLNFKYLYILSRIITLFKIPYEVNYNSFKFFISNNTILINSTFLTLKYTFLIVAAFFTLTPGKTFNKLAVSILIFLLIISINLSLTSYYILYFNYIQNKIHLNIHLIFHSLIFLLPLIYSLLLNRKCLKKHVADICQIKSFEINIFVIQLFFIFFLISFISLFLEIEPVYNFLTKLIYHISILILSQFNIQAVINGRYLIHNQNFIFMGDPCVGVNLMTTFIIVILITAQKYKTGILFSILGVLVILILNAFRVSLLFAYLIENGNNTLNIKQWHSIYNNIIYGFVLFLWYYWFKCNYTALNNLNNT